jgi:hypothetical protein
MSVEGSELLLDVGGDGCEREGLQAACGATDVARLQERMHSGRKRAGQREEAGGEFVGGCRRSCSLRTHVLQVALHPTVRCEAVQGCEGASLCRG